jgi:hypothetical protein
MLHQHYFRIKFFSDDIDPASELSAPLIEAADADNLNDVHDQDKSPKLKRRRLTTDNFSGSLSPIPR